MRLFIFTLCAITVFSLPAQAECDGRIEQNQNAGDREYDPFDATDFRKRYTVTIRNIGDETCNFIIAFERHPVGGWLAPGLSYRIEDVTGRSLLTDNSPSQADPRVLIFSGVPPSQTTSIDFFMVMPRGQFAFPHTYRDDDVIMKLYSQARSGLISRQSHDETSLQISQTVKSSVNINIAGGGIHTTLNFNALSSGKERTIAIQTRANQRYKLTLRSENGSVLRLDADMEGEQWKIPYSLKVDTLPVALSIPAVLRRSTELLTAGQENHTLTFRIEDAIDRRAGKYRDVVTVEIAPE